MTIDKRHPMTIANIDADAESIVVGLAFQGHVDRRVGPDMIFDKCLKIIFQQLIDRPRLIAGTTMFKDACRMAAVLADIDTATMDRRLNEVVDWNVMFNGPCPMTDRAIEQVLHLQVVTESLAQLGRTQQAFERGTAGHRELARAHAAVDAAERSFGISRVPETLSELLDAVDAKRARYRGREHIGLHTPGLPRLSGRLDGWRGLLFLTAAPGVGKTTLLMQAGLDAVRANPEACFVFLSLEMPKSTMTVRLLSHMSGVSMKYILKGQLDDVDRTSGRTTAELDADVLTADHNLRKLKHRIGLFGLDDIGMMGGDDPSIALDPMVDLVERFRKSSECPRAFVLVDSFQRLQLKLKSLGTGRWDPLERDTYATTALMSAWHRLGEDDPVAVVAHSTKDGMKQGRPSMTDVRGSGDIIYGGECVVGMSKSDNPNAGPDDVVVELLKGRDMMTRGAVEMRFDHQVSAFVELGDAT